jgi:hypothetical protein
MAGQEMLSADTVPQRGGMRMCSVHSKGDCVDPVIARITQGQSYRHAIGFEANEQARAEKDRLYDNDVRAGRLVSLAGLGLVTRGLPALPASCSRALWTPAAVRARL